MRFVSRKLKITLRSKFEKTVILHNDSSIGKTNTTWFSQRLLQIVSPSDFSKFDPDFSLWHKRPGCLVDGKCYSGCNSEKVKEAYLECCVSQKCNCKARTVQIWVIVSALTEIASDLGWKALTLAPFLSFSYLIIVGLVFEIKMYQREWNSFKKKLRTKWKNTRFTRFSLYLFELHLLSLSSPLTFFYQLYQQKN